MSRLKRVVFGTLFAFGASLVGVFILDLRPLTAAESFLLGFIGAWCGERSGK